jgi:hypothetical protein
MVPGFRGVSTFDFMPLPTDGSSFSYSIGVSIPSELGRRLRLWKRSPAQLHGAVAAVVAPPGL